MVIELEARLTAASDSKIQAGLRMCLEATIRRPKSNDGFGLDTTESLQASNAEEPK